MDREPENKDNALHSLEGLLKGVWMDGDVNEEEIKLLSEWTRTHQHFSGEAPFDELLPELAKVLNDGVFEKSELDDLIWLIEGYKMFADADQGFLPGSLRLKGILEGVVADNDVSLRELKGLHDWLQFVKKDSLSPACIDIKELVEDAMKEQDISEDTLSKLLHVFRGFLANFKNPSD